MRATSDSGLTWWQGSLVGLGIGGAVAGVVTVVALRRVEMPGVPTKKEMRAALRTAGDLLGQALTWPELGQMVDATAATESGWNWRPYGRVPEPGSNDATGPMQLRPRSAGDSPKMRSIILADPTLVEDPNVAVAAAVAYWSRLSDNAPFATWGDVRASFAYPIFIHGYPTSVPEVLRYRAALDIDEDGEVELWEWQQRYVDALKRFRSGLKAAGVPTSFANRRAFPRVANYKVLDLLAVVPSDRGAELIGAMAA